MVAEMWHHQGIERSAIYSSLSCLALYLLAFSEIRSMLFIFSKPIITFTISAKDGIQVQIFQELAADVLSLFQQ